MIYALQEVLLEVQVNKFSFYFIAPSTWYNACTGTRNSCGISWSSITWCTPQHTFTKSCATEVKQHQQYHPGTTVPARLLDDRSVESRVIVESRESTACLPGSGRLRQGFLETSWSCKKTNIIECHQHSTAIQSEYTQDKTSDTWLDNEISGCVNVTMVQGNQSGACQAGRNNDFCPQLQERNTEQP